MSDAELRDVRWKEIAVVFQGAMNSLNPVQKISAQLLEPIRQHEPKVSARRSPNAESTGLLRCGRHRPETWP